MDYFFFGNVVYFPYLAFFLRIIYFSTAIGIIYFIYSIVPFFINF